MKKISIAFYSTFKKPGWKSEQLEVLVPQLKKENMFCKGYGIKRFEAVQEQDLVLSIYPLVLSKILSKLKFFSFIKGYYPYLLGELLTGSFFSKKISRDSSSIVYLKPRPMHIVKECKKNGKTIVLEFGEMHPNDTCERLLSEYKKYDIHREYIFTSKYAIEQSLVSIELADVIVVLSEESKKSFMRNGVTEDKIRVINLNLEKKYNGIYSDEKEFAFVSTATHSFVKGTHSLLLAWRRANINNMKLHIVGDLSEDIIDFINVHGPFDNVIFSGKQDINEYYNKFNFIGILNSLSEGFGRSVIEYMGYGFPVITTPVATCDLVENNVNGFVINDENELITALNYFSTSSNKYQEMGNRARISAESTLNSDFTTSLVTLFKEL